MAIDPSIITSGIRPPTPIQIDDPLSSYGKAVQLKALVGQNQMQGIQMQQAQQQLADDQAVRQAWQEGGGDAAKIRDLLAQRGQYKAAMAFDKANLENKKIQGDIDKTHSEIFDKQWNAFKPIVAGTQTPDQARAALAAQYNSPVLGEHLKTIGPLDALLKQVPDDPNAFQGWKTQYLEGMDKYNTMVQQKADLAERGRHNIVEEKQGQQRIGIEGGNLSLARERFNFEKSQPQGQVLPEQGVIVDKRTGKTIPITDQTGAPIVPTGKLTESQGKAAGMALRAQRADDILNQLEAAGFNNRGVIKQAAGNIPLVGGAAEMVVNTLPGIVGGPSSEQRRVEQARRDFVNAVLRVESGASISQSEFTNAEKQYFPMPGEGDDRATIEQKRANRAKAIDSLKMQAGPAATQIKSAISGKIGGATGGGADVSKLSDAELKRELGL